MACAEDGKWRWDELASSRGWLTAVFLLLAACASHRARPVAGGLPPSYPPIAVESVRVADRRPAVAYDEIGIVTVQDETAKPLAASVEEIRQVAAQAGANTAVLLTEQTFRQHNGVTGRRTSMRRLVALLIHRKDLFTPPLANPQNLPVPPMPTPSPRLERSGPPPPRPTGAPPGTTGI